MQYSFIDGETEGILAEGRRLSKCGSRPKAAWISKVSGVVVCYSGVGFGVGIWVFE